MTAPSERSRMTDRSEGRLATGRWLRRALPRPHATVRLLCCPHAGGSATFFRTWGRLLPASVEVLAVQYPGRLDRLNEPCVEDLHQLADAVVEALARQPPLPIAVFGHSMGAAVAYETVRRLEARGDEVRGLVVSSHPAPGGAGASAAGGLSDDELRHELRRLGATPSMVIDDPELAALVLRSMRADYRAVASYRPRPGPSLACPVAAMVGDADPDVDASGMAAWAAVTNGPLTVRELPGDHFYLTPEVSAVLDELSDHLGVKEA